LSPARTYRDEFPALTGIRFPLALWIVLHHLSGPGRMLDPLTSYFPMVQTLTGAAWMALGTFFAISGFVLALGYRTAKWNRTTSCQYLIARFSRLYPVYLLSLLIVAPIMYRAVLNDDLGSLGDRAWLVFNYCFLLQGWAPLPVDWNTPAWSLSSEVFFYACFPFAILLLRRVSWPLVLLTLGLAFVVPVAIRLMGVPTTCKPLIYLGDFLLGIGAAGLYEILKRNRIPLTGRGDWLYGPASVVALVLLLNNDLFGNFLVFDTVLRFANGALILGLAFGGGLGCSAISSPLALWGGRASYAIYILHVPILWWYKRSIAYLMLPPVAAGLLYAGIVVAASAIVWRWYEQPANTFLRQKLGSWLGRSKFGEGRVHRTTLKEVPDAPKAVPAIYQ
jgi:peptidoglycan/LPS O-acetylase OafA/YrhL